MRGTRRALAFEHSSLFPIFSSSAMSYSHLCGAAKASSLFHTVRVLLPPHSVQLLLNTISHSLCTHPVSVPHCPLTSTSIVSIPHFPLISISTGSTSHPVSCTSGLSAGSGSKYRRSRLLMQHEFVRGQVEGSVPSSAERWLFFFLTSPTNRVKRLVGAPSHPFFFSSIIGLNLLYRQEFKFAVSK